MQLTGHKRQEPTNRALRPGELFGIVAFWAFLAILTAAGRVLDPRTPNDAAFSRGLITLAFVEYSMWAALTVIIFVLVSRLGPVERGWLRRAAAFIAVGFLIAVAVDWTLFLFRQHLLGPPRFSRGGPPSGLRNIIRLEFLDDFLIYVAVIAAAFARDYFIRYQARLVEARALHAQLAEARLNVLRAQLNPHFLFNTLNAISSLVDSDPRGVRRMISRLGDLLRHTLEETNEAEITLDREMELLRRYLDIMEIRFQGALDVKIDVAPDLLAALVPNMILQPLAENAFEHGLAGVSAGAKLEVRVRRIDQRLCLTVTDNGPGPSASPGTDGIGIRNTIDRLAELYGSAATFSLHGRGDGVDGAIAEISLPFHLTPQGPRHD